jgi:hypothetical protein
MKDALACSLFEQKAFTGMVFAVFRFEKMDYLLY